LRSATFPVHPEDGLGPRVGSNAWIDRKEYYLHDLRRILGALCQVVRESRAAYPRSA